MAPGVLMIKDSDLPEGFEKWPKDVRDRYFREFHALYFPDGCFNCGLDDHVSRIPSDLWLKVQAKAAGMHLNVGDGVVLALEQWAGE